MLMGGLDLPVRAIRQQISGAVNLIVHVNRLADGSRKVVAIAELAGFDDPTIAVQELFVSEATGGTTQGRSRLVPTGMRPQIMDKIHRLQLGGPELARLYPKNPAAITMSGRRSLPSVAEPGGIPQYERRQP